MPAISSFVLSQSIRTSSTFTGATWAPLSEAIGTAIALWFNTQGNINITGFASGSAGVGVVNGVMTFPALPTFVQVAISSSTLSGVLAVELFNAVSLGCAQNMGAVPYVGASPVVGSGIESNASVSAVNQPLLEQMLYAQITGAFAGGVPQLNQSLLSKGISVALAQQILLGTNLSQGVVTGSASPSISSGPTFSVIGV